MERNGPASKIIKVTSKFKKDIQKSLARGKDYKKLDLILTLLCLEKTIPEAHRNHKLHGKYHNHLELHIEPDWLLIYVKNDDAIILVRTGTHSDLF